ncbi:PREDICTED: guanine nucleotide-binding protein subunit beta-like protein 1 [Priapulus caudatus]|uniref:Guanine nucleotide-binding protein subunit beta-like protein 1 n=1 Tax=Priapulus caudatus TaxID=37621 RepID=A0ABM1EEE6_PRICU|nr:PREDICTED: guanine nucleotide-binding protein subunit beta-like protein 1 [Priapulus caudatus]
MRRESPDPLFMLHGSNAPISAVHFWNPGEGSKWKLLSGTAQGKIHIWDVESRRSDVILSTAHGKGILWLEGLDSNSFLSQCRDGELSKWTLEAAGWQSKCIGRTGVGFCGSSRSGSLLAKPAADDRSFELIDLTSGNVAQTFRAGDDAGMPMCVALRRRDMTDAPVLFAGYESGEVRAWDATGRGEVGTSLRPHRDPALAMDVDATLRGVSGSVDEALQGWRHHEGRLVDGGSTTMTSAGVGAVTIRDDRAIVAVARWDSHISVFDWKKFKPLAVLACHQEAVQCLDFRTASVEPHLLVAGSKDTLLSVWQLY